MQSVARLLQALRILAAGQILLCAYTLFSYESRVSDIMPLIRGEAVPEEIAKWVKTAGWGGVIFGLASFVIASGALGSVEKLALGAQNPPDARWDDAGK